MPGVVIAIVAALALGVALNSEGAVPLARRRTPVTVLETLGRAAREARVK
jgi:hypothetical protein